MYQKFHSTFRRVAVTCAFALGILACQEAGAVPARQTPYTVTQPDGSQITVRMVGDERAHFIVDMAGHLLCQNKNGIYHYGEIDTDGIVVCSDVVAATADKHTRAADLDRFNADRLIPKAMQLREQSGMIKTNRANRMAAAAKWNNTDCKDPDFRMLFTDFPSTGKNKGLVILVEFSDMQFTQENPKEYFTSMLNDEGFSENGCIGSASDFFVKSSMGQFTPEFDVYGPVNLGKSYSYYGANNAYGSDLRPEEMILDACRLLDDEIDFTQYNLDGDDKVDCVYVFYAGFGEADNPETTEYKNTVWPHTWDVYTATKKKCVVDGLIIDHYACSNERRGVYSNKPKATVGIGTFVHEFSHVMGIPDLYDINYATDNKGNLLCYTPGSWTTLDQGSYNKDGCVPPLYSSFERFSLGWIKPKEFRATKEYTINELSENNEAYIIYTERPTEFFLLENRQKNGFDESLSGHGMLVWHVDFSQNLWNRNSVNTNSKHQYVDLMEANGITYVQSSYFPERQRAAESFPGSGNVTQLNAETTPALTSWAGKSTIISLSDIAENDGVITMNVANAENPSEHDAVTELGADSNTFSVWTSGNSIFTDASAAKVYDSVGRLCGSIAADSSITLSPGIYIVAADGKSVKTIIR